MDELGDLLDDGRQPREAEVAVRVGHHGGAGLSSRRWAGGRRQAGGRARGSACKLEVMPLCVGLLPAPTPQPPRAREPAGALARLDDNAPRVREVAAGAHGEGAPRDGQVQTKRFHGVWREQTSGDNVARRFEP